MENQNKIFNLEERTLEFAKNCLDLSRILVNSIENIEHRKQFVRSSGSVGANYREANEAVSKKDFVHRLRICRKEAKETNYWLKLILYVNPDLEKNIKPKIQESMELVKIFSSIIEKNQ